VRVAQPTACIGYDLTLAVKPLKCGPVRDVGCCQDDLGHRLHAKLPGWSEERWRSGTGGRVHSMLSGAAFGPAVVVQQLVHLSQARN
jgi:hypothetical protein